jgi:hypothetical protein
VTKMKYDISVKDRSGVVTHEDCSVREKQEILKMVKDSPSLTVKSIERKGGE